MTIQRVTVTPQMAATMLLRNESNRPLRDSRVKSYAHDMATGAFDGRAVHIYVDPDGVLLNGQHTLTAVVRSGIALHNVLIETNVDRSVMDHIDRGLPRNVRDALSFRSVRNLKTVSSILRAHTLISKHRNVVWTGSLSITESDLVSLYESRPALFDHVALIQQRAQKESGISSQYGGLAAYLDAIDSPEWEQFDIGVRTGESLSKGDPRLTLRNWVRSQSRMSGHGTSQQQYRAVCITKAWNAWVRDEELLILKWPGRVLPMPTPILLNSSLMGASA